MSYFCRFFRVQTNDWTQETAILFSRALKIAKYTAVLPYDWNVQRQQLEYTKSRFRILAFMLQYILYLVYEGFVIYQWISFSIDVNATTKDKGALQYVVVAYVVPVISHSSSFFNRHSLHNFVNQLLRYIRNDFQRLPNDTRKLQSAGTFMRNFTLVAISILSLNLTTLFRRPESPHLLSSLVPDVKGRPKWELIPFAVFHGYIWCNQWASMYFYSVLFMSHISATQNALNRTRPNHRLSPGRFYGATRTLEVLQGNYNALVRWVWWTFECIVVPVCVLGFCGGIWSEGAQSARLLVISTMSLGALLTFFKGLGSVFETSSEVLADWRRADELLSLLFRKRLKSIRAIRVHIGGYFYVDAAMTLTLLAIVSQNTFNVLLAA